MMRYVTLDQCREQVFPFIQEHLTKTEAAPDYEHETSGMEELEKVLSFVQNDTYYPSLAEKASYILCSIAGAQYFSNGNKRMGIALLMYFLIVNDVSVKWLEKEIYVEMLLESFSEHSWEKNRNIRGRHSLFLYNLAIVIGDRNKWSGADFTELKQRIAKIFEELYKENY